MILSSLLPLFLSAQAILASPLQAEPRSTNEKPPFFLLAGDSTTAHDYGWGDGFLQHTLKSPAGGINYGIVGATAHSFRKSGNWPKLLAQIGRHADKNAIVTIQFGHNDQKPWARESIGEYKGNLTAMVDSVRRRNGKPVLITSLTRRRFEDGRVVQDLAAQRAATLQVARDRNVLFVDLNIKSTDYCNAIGEKASWAFNRLNATASGDTTHLNARGSKVFGRLVSDRLVKKYPRQFKKWTRPDAALSEKLRDGKPA